MKDTTVITTQRIFSFTPTLWFYHSEKIGDTAYKWYLLEISTSCFLTRTHRSTCRVAVPVDFWASFDSSIPVVDPACGFCILVHRHTRFSFVQIRQLHGLINNWIQSNHHNNDTTTRWLPLEKIAKLLDLNVPLSSRRRSWSCTLSMLFARLVVSLEWLLGNLGLAHGRMILVPKKDTYDYVSQIRHCVRPVYICVVLSLLANITSLYTYVLSWNAPRPQAEHSNHGSYR